MTILLLKLPVLWVRGLSLQYLAMGWFMGAPDPQTRAPEEWTNASLDEIVAALESAGDRSEDLMGILATLPFPAQCHPNLQEVAKEYADLSGTSIKTKASASGTMPCPTPVAVD